MRDFDIAKSLMWSHKLYEGVSMPEMKAPKSLVLLDPGVLPECMRWYEFLLCSPHFSKKSSCISPLPEF